MSLNKILNRPMFRQKALKKGHLKPIHAQVGTMVGQPVTSPSVPAIRKQPTFFERMKVSSPVRFIKEGFSLPVNLGFQAGGVTADALGIDNPVLRFGLESAGAFGAAKNLPRLGIGAIGLGPTAIGLGALYGLKNRYDAGKKEYARIQAMTPAERKAFSENQRLKAFDYYGVTDADLFGKVQPGKLDKELKQTKSGKTKQLEEMFAGKDTRPFKKEEKQLKAEGDQLLADNVVTSDDVADLDKVQENSLGMPPGPPGSSDEDAVTAETKKFPKKEEVDKTTDMAVKPTPTEEKSFKGDDSRQTQNEINVGGISEDPTFNQTIQLAKKYYDEVYEGRGSQANLVFLANLASGLLSGTSRDRGIGGAMQILGQALGPAVNNYATIKLKEGELRQNAREASLNAAMDHMEFLNENARTETEYPDRTGGVIQIRGADGRLRNYKGYTLKDGTIQMAAGKGPDGREQFVTVSQGSPIEDSQGNVIGRFEDFKEQKAISTRLTDLHDILGNRYDALATAREVLGIIGQEDAKAGAALTVDTFTRRMLGVGKELLGGTTILDLDSEMANLESLYKDEIAALDRALAAGEITESEYERNKKALDIGEFEEGGLLDEARKRILNNSGKKGFYSNLSREDQETLAVYETKLVYALANTFKDQDRLTQRDINAAKEIVNIFSLSRSSADVRASIQAIARGLESDIRRQEKLFTAAGGLESSLQDLRSLKDFTPFDSQSDLAGKLSKDLGIEEITKELEKLEL